MTLYIDAGNTRLKWCLAEDGQVEASGVGVLGQQNPFNGLKGSATQVTRVAVSTVASEDNRDQLLCALTELGSAPVRFYWSEQTRGGLVNAYPDASLMGADRWHAMYGAWREHKRGFVLVDAGSAVTVDYVSRNGQHQGGYILPGLQMMLRSLRTDAARIWFDPEQGLATGPGTNTGECVNHGLAWLCASMIDRIRADARRLDLAQVLVTGGDAQRLIGLGLPGIHLPDLVLSGLRAIDAEDTAR